MKAAALMTGLRVFAAGQGLAAQGRERPGVWRAGLGKPLQGERAQRLAQELSSKVQALVESTEEVLRRRPGRRGPGLFGGQGLQEKAA